MTAFLKLYTDNAHASEVAHTNQASTTLGAAAAIGATSITVASITGMAASGVVDIDTAGNLESIPYVSVSGTTVYLARATTIAHANGVGVVQWYYSLAIGDQTNGIVNDGTNAAPNGIGTNVATWYVYNAGDQIAQSPIFNTVSGSPSTASGFSDTQISITSATAGFGANVSPAAIAAGSQQQVWVTANIPANQSPAGNPQICQINFQYSSI